MSRWVETRLRAYSTNVRCCRCSTVNLNLSPSRMSALPPKADIVQPGGNVRFRDCDAERFDRGQIDNKIELGGPFDWKVGRLRAAQDLPGLLAWHIILVLAQPRRKRDPDSPVREAPTLGEIVEDHLGRVLVGDS